MPATRAVVVVGLALLAVVWRPEPVLTQGPEPGVVVPLRREVRIGLPAVPVPLEPATALEGPAALVARQVFDTLVAYRESTTDVEPALATRWRVSRDGLVWSFTLRPGVRFHDGSALTAAEVAQSFERHLTLEPREGHGVWARLLRGNPGVLREVRAPDERTVQFVLMQPYAPLLTALAHPGLGVVRATRGADGTSRLVGTGPYRVVDASPGRLALEAAPHHWAGPPASVRLVFLEVAADDQAEAQLDTRSLDVWFPAGPPRRTLGALSVPGLRVGYLALQTEKEPFSNPKVRRAVAGALDPAVLGQVLDRAAVPLQSFLPTGVWARREGLPVLGGRREAVRALLAGNPWPRESSPALLVPAANEPVNFPKLGEAIQLLLGDGGMPAVLQVEPEPTVRTLLQAGAYDMALAEALVAGGDPHLFLFPLSTSEGATKGPLAANYSYYRNPRLDDLLIRASQLAYRPERRRLYQRAQALLGEEVPWIPLYVRLHWAVVRPDVRGLRLHPTGFHRLDRVGLEWTESR